MTRNGWKTAKRVRVFFSLSFLVLVTLIFTDPWHRIPLIFPQYLTSLEIVPGLLKVIVVGGAVTTCGFLLVIFVTFLFGRVYCSSVCPVGTVQDISIRIARMFNRRKRFEYSRSPQWLQYPILLALVLMVLFGSMMILGDLLEPFSNYGRLVTNFGVPLIVMLNNLVASILARFQIFSIYEIPLPQLEIGTLVFSFIFFATVIYISAAKGRFFCNSFCPAGALLSLISHVSLFRLGIVENQCDDCRACDKVCKAECVDSKTKRIDFGSCVGCFNCLRSCPKNGIKYVARYSLRKKFKFSFSMHVWPNENHSTFALSSRRQLIRNIGIPATALLLAPGLVKGGGIFYNRRSSHSDGRRAVSPPGSLSIDHFTAVCTACQMCVASCPTNVLRPSFLEYGIAGMSQPLMDYEIAYCNYDCVICGDACPTGAILKKSVEEKKRIQIGKTTFTKDDCIVVSKKKDCAACSEHCPTKAVHTVPYEGNLLLPEVDNEMCIGCGACEHVCPTTPKKAIRIVANAIHVVAKPPRAVSEPGVKQKPINNFPF